MAMHAGELPIDAAVARDLIGAQFPQWRGTHVRRVTSSGTVNAIFRLGDRLAARFPLQSADPAATRQDLESEAAAAREFAAATRFPVPAFVALGEPGPGYPLPWSVQTWLPGRTGDEDDLSGEVTFATDLAEFIAAVRAIGTRGRTFARRDRRPDPRTPRIDAAIIGASAAAGGSAPTIPAIAAANRCARSGRLCRSTTVT